MADGRIAANKNRSKISDAELIEACKTMTINEIADKFGMHHAQIRRRCRVNGWKPVGYGNPNYRSITMASVNARGLSGGGVSVFGDCWHYVESHDQCFRKRFPDFQYLETKTKTKIRIKCKKCGNISDRSFSVLRQQSIRCECYKEQSELQDERIRLMRFFIALAESKRSKTCDVCGKEYYSASPESKYCSKHCKNKRKGSKIRSRCRKYGAYYDPSIIPRKVFERDGYVCRICGQKCDTEDHLWGHVGPYSPSIDHIVALANGGNHTWDNVQCAHMICNSYKRDLMA